MREKKEQNSDELTLTLASKWADATPLYIYLTDRANQLLPQLNPKALRIDDSPISLAVRVFHGDFNAQRAVDMAKAEVANDLIAGRLICLGRKPSSFQFEEIDPSHWIGADVDWESGGITRGDQEVIEIRVLSEPTIDRKTETREPGRPGRPSKGDVITEAIAAYSANDPGLTAPRRDRFSAYHSHISERGYDTRQDTGFSDKTIEKYEAKFRNKNR